MADRKAIPIATRFRLFADASGHCQNPNCLDALFPAEMGGEKHIAEMAHVIPFAVRPLLAGVLEKRTFRCAGSP